LGNSGLRVSEAALGTPTFGDDWGWGGNFIDTANLYTNGTSESFLGEFTKGHARAW
jgi:aryl-alcohol dehydrogenase-like predicted oxidoreductase